MKSRLMVAVMLAGALALLYGCEACDDENVVDGEGLCYVEVLEAADSTDLGEDIVARIAGVVGSDTCCHLERIEREKIGTTWVLRPIAHRRMSGCGCCPQVAVHFDELVNLGPAGAGWVFLRSESQGPVLVESTFVRVPPAPADTFTYTGYVGMERAVEGQFTVWEYSPGTVLGEWRFTCIRDSCPEAGPQVGEGPLSGWISEGRMQISLGPWRDNNVVLMGDLAGDTYSGMWKWVGFSGRIIEAGDFEAVKK